MDEKNLNRRQMLGAVAAARPPMPGHIAAGRDRYYRTPIYVQEIQHRRATCKRNNPGV